MRNHSLLLGFTLLLTTQVSFANEETRTWPSRRIDILRSRYVDATGAPSRTEFLRAHGLLPSRSSVAVSPQFMASFAKADGSESGGPLRPKANAQLLNLDFQLVTTRTEESPNRALPIWDGRVYEEGNRLIVGGYSSRHNERPVGEIDERGLFLHAGSLGSNDFPLLAIPAREIVFDPFEWKLFRVVPTDGQPTVSSSKEFLPLRLRDETGRALTNLHFVMQPVPGHPAIQLVARQGSRGYPIAQCDLATSPVIATRQGFQPRLQEGCTQIVNGEIVTAAFEAKLGEAVSLRDGHLVLPSDWSVDDETAPPRIAPGIRIDGDFQDWRNVAGHGDPRGDCVSYLHPNPDSDLLEIKIANDDRHLYFYSRVAGAHGRTGDKGRYYWYAYIDVDRNPATGYPPTRDDNCYFGVPIGDDCEAQFEFVGNRFIKTFFGFTGAGAEEAVLKGALTLGPSYYSARDPAGNRRERYKVEYVNRNGSRFITHDHTEGTSEDIVMALSPDGSEVEVRVELAGFLQDATGKPLVARGQTIDLAIGAECASDRYHSDRWGADSTRVIYGYEIK